MSPSLTNPVLQARQLNFSYPDAAPLLRDWSADVPAGVTWLHGDTGSGKSTVLRLLSGSEPVDGHLRLNGVDLAVDPQAYRRQVFLCDASTTDYDDITARACTRALCADDAHFDPALWQTLVDGFGLAPHVDKPVYMLSTGSRRKLWLAAALAAGRRLTLLDEPAAALDMGSVRRLWTALSEVGGQGDRAVIVASADPVAPVSLAGSIFLPGAQSN